LSGDTAGASKAYAISKLFAGQRDSALDQVFQAQGFPTHGKFCIEG
jgi:hypothetical protein